MLLKYVRPLNSSKKRNRRGRRILGGVVGSLCGTTCQLLDLRHVDCRKMDEEPNGRAAQRKAPCQGTG